MSFQTHTVSYLHHCIPLMICLMDYCLNLAVLKQVVLFTMLGFVLYTEFLIDYYEYCFDYLVTIMNQFTINAHT